MAIMHPKFVIKFNTLSEEKLYYAFKNQLSDNYEVFYSVTWYSKDQGGKRINSESDFIIVDREKGFLCIEVKGGIKYVHENDKYIVYNSNGDTIVKDISAFQQAENSMRYFLDLYETTYNMDYKGVYGFMSAFPMYEIKDEVETNFNQVKDITIDMNDMNNNLEKCVRQAFLYWGNRNSYIEDLFTSESRKKLCDMLKRVYAIEASKGALIEYKNSELEKINEVQDNIINLLKNYKVFAMKGAAGTGKSWIAYKMAKRSAIDERRETLLLSKSKYLADYFRKINNIENSNLSIICFDELLEQIGERDINIIDISNVKKYGVIIIDEAQDFSPDEAVFIRTLLYEDKSSEFYVFYDDEQNLYNNNLEDVLNNFIIESKPYLLTENLRNTKNIYDWAKNRTSLGETSFSNQVDGPEPIMSSLNNKNQAIRYINNAISNLVNRDKVPKCFINIIIDDDIYDEIINEGFDFENRNEVNSKDDNFIGIFKVSEYKGLESNIILYLHSENSEYNFKYVGLTRARFYLYDIEIKDRY